MQSTFDLSRSLRRMHRVAYTNYIPIGIHSRSRGGSGTRAKFVFVFEFESVLHEGVSGTLEDGRRGGIEGSGELSGKDVSEGRRASGVSGFLVGGGKEGTESGPVIAVGGGWVRTVLAQFPRRNGRQLWHCRPPFTHEQFRQRPVRLHLQQVIFQTLHIKYGTSAGNQTLHGTLLTLVSYTWCYAWDKNKSHAPRVHMGEV